jgi:hypothetical protein
MFVAWVIFPLVLAALCLGCGVFVRTLTAAPIPGPLLLPLGFAVVMVVGEFTSLADSTAELTAPIVGGMALAGFLLAGTRLFRGVDRWAIAAAGGVFLVYAAPIVFSGEPTIAGYIKLDDTATWLALADYISEHGRSVSGLAPSTYEATLDFNLADGYPIGAFIPFGTGAVFVGKDIAWLIQPYMAFVASLLGLSLYALTDRVLESRALRAVCSFIAAQAALLFGYYLWGGIKEIAAAAIIALSCALIPLAFDAWRSWRAAVPLAISVAAAAALLTVAGAAVWIGPALALGLLLLLRTTGADHALRTVGILAGAVCVLALPWLLGLPLLPPTSSPLDATDAVGNLGGPLNAFQAFGIWPTGDFRVDPVDGVSAAILIACVVGGIVVGTLIAWRRNAARFLIVFCGSVAISTAILLLEGSPWVGGKALATGSVAVLLAGVVGAALLIERGYGVEGGVVLVAIVGGVLWSNALAYRDVWLAPYDKLAELEQVGKRIEGEGPTLMTEYEPYGVRHFLRDSDPEGASELRRRQVELVGGGTLDKAEFRDIDAFQLTSLLPYETLVLRRSPLGSRPPLPFQLTWSGRYYDVWQRPANAPAPLEHLPLSTGQLPAAVPPCSEIQRLASAPGVRTLAASRARSPLVVQLGSLAGHADWRRDAAGLIYPNDSGTLEGNFGTAGGPQTVWLGGSVRGRAEVEIDGQAVGSRENSLDRANQLTQLGSLQLSPGTHDVRITFEAGGLAPGSGKPPFGVGPLVIAPQVSDEGDVRYVAPARAASLCGLRLDWVEALAANVASAG